MHHRVHEVGEKLLGYWWTLAPMWLDACSLCIPPFCEPRAILVNEHFSLTTYQSIYDDDGVSVQKNNTRKVNHNRADAKEKKASRIYHK